MRSLIPVQPLPGLEKLEILRSHLYPKSYWLPVGETERDVVTRIQHTKKAIQREKRWRFIQRVFRPNEARIFAQIDNISVKPESPDFLQDSMVKQLIKQQPLAALKAYVKRYRDLVSLRIMDEIVGPTRQPVMHADHEGRLDWARAYYVQAAKQGFPLHFHTPSQFKGAQSLLTLRHALNAATQAGNR